MWEFCGNSFHRVAIVFSQNFYTRKLSKIRHKKVVLFPEIDRVKFFSSLTRPHSRMCIRIHVFNFKKQTNKPKNKNTKKAKETKEEKRISQENRLRKINLRLPGWRFFSSPAFPEKRVLFWAYSILYSGCKTRKGRGLCSSSLS